MGSPRQSPTALGGPQGELPLPDAIRLDSGAACVPQSTDHGRRSGRRQRSRSVSFSGSMDHAEAASSSGGAGGGPAASSGSVLMRLSRGGSSGSGTGAGRSSSRVSREQDPSDAYGEHGTSQRGSSVSLLQRLTAPRGAVVGKPPPPAAAPATNAPGRAGSKGLLARGGKPPTHAGGRSRGGSDRNVTPGAAG